MVTGVEKRQCSICPSRDWRSPNIRG
jgi:hypothetical protein